MRVSGTWNVAPKESLGAGRDASGRGARRRARERPTGAFANVHGMSPRRGGEADKFGNRFEGRWTVSYILAVLAGRVRSVIIEQPGEDGKGIEFVAEGSDGVCESHQVKRQRGNANSWSLRNLAKEGVLTAAAAQVAVGRRFVFVSLIPCRVLDELAERARGTDDLQIFMAELTKKLGPDFDFLVLQWGGPAEAYEILQFVYVRWPDERHIVHTNAAMAELLLAGAAGAASAASIGDLVSDNLGRTLDAAAIETALSAYELTRAQLVGPTTTQAVAASLADWSQSVVSELLEPEIPRQESHDLIERLRLPETTMLLVTGAAGDGKSAVLYQTVRALAEQMPVLAMRLDRIEPFSSTHELGVDRLGLPASPSATLAAAAQGGECLLVIDQLDAVSLASGRMPTTFDHVASLLREAQAFEGMRVLLACRKFDVDNDHRLRALVDDDGPAEQLAIEGLDAGRAAGAVTNMGLEPAALSETQKQLLRSPLNLVLLSAISDQANAMSFSSVKGLMDAFYDRKRRDCRTRRDPPPRFADTLALLTDDMSNNQRLSSPQSILDRGDFQEDADVLTSEHVLVRQGNRIGFFHEAFFDYVFARRWLSREETLVSFLLSGEQELFRRAQVRQVLIHVRTEDPDRFVVEVDSLLAEPGIRFHVQEVVLAILRAIDDPTPAERQLIERHISVDSPIVERLWSTMRSVGWFDRLDQDGVLSAWLMSRDTDLQHRAIDVMSAATKERPARIARLLAVIAHDPIYPGALRWIAFRVDFEDSREIFDLVLAGIRSGLYDEHEHDLFMGAHALGGTRPGWACEMLAAWFVERPEAMTLNGHGKIAALDSSDYGAQEIIRAAAANAPAAFAGVVVPYIQEAMVATSEGDRPKQDRHFGLRSYNAEHHQLDDSLLYGARDALRAMSTNPDETTDFGILLDTLTADVHDGAQWLLYEALIAAGDACANRAFGLLIEGQSRLACGYMCNTWWTTRQLVQAIGSGLSDKQVAELEAIFLNLRPDWENRPGGYSSFTLLSALPTERLSHQGRLRLGELRRLFSQEQPDEPIGIRVGMIGPPIPQQAAQRMNDEQWLKAIAKHAGDRTDWSSFTGGADELARVLELETSAQPERFARLALRLDASSHPAYLNGVLHGLRQTDQDLDPELVYEVMRHVASLGRPDHDRSIPDGLRRRYDEDVPDDIIELILGIALHSNDPSDEAWQREASSGQMFYRGDPFFNGMNTARGSAALVVGDLLVHDIDGHRSALIEPSIETLASDPSLAVRSCVAHVMAAALRHARPSVIDALAVFLQAPDELLATQRVESLIIYVGFGDSEAVEPIIGRMMSSEIVGTREAGGRLAAFAGLELELPDLLVAAMTSEDSEVRLGAAKICARRLPVTADADAATKALTAYIEDPDDKVRDAAAEVAAALRDHPLEPHRPLIGSLIASRAFDASLPQLLITLERATERVDDLVVATARRFIEVNSGQLSSIATRAAGDSRELGHLLLRAYAQAPHAEARATVLDLIDELLSAAAYDLARLVGEAER